MWINLELKFHLKFSIFSVWEEHLHSTTKALIITCLVNCSFQTLRDRDELVDTRVGCNNRLNKA